MTAMYTIQKPAPRRDGSKTTYCLLKTQRIGRGDVLLDVRIVEVDLADTVSAW